MTKRLIEDDFTAVEAVIGEKVVWVVPYKDIYEAPTVDAEPIRHGTWKEEKVKIDSQFSLSIPCYLCSECGGYMDASTLLFKYCPYCGAKMDGGKNDKTD